jgi:hypothetical protein
MNQALVWVDVAINESSEGQIRSEHTSRALKRANGSLLSRLVVPQAALFVRQGFPRAKTFKQHSFIGPVSKIGSIQHQRMVGH